MWGVEEAAPLASDGTSCHHGSLGRLQGGTYASIRLSLSATTPWDDEEGSTLQAELAFDWGEVPRQHVVVDDTYRSTGSSLYTQSAVASIQVEQGWFPSHRRFRCLQKSQARRAP